MTAFQKKILIFIIVLSVISPLGLWLPEYFNSRDAFGEWSLTTTGNNGNTKSIKSPLDNYTIDKKDKSIYHQVFYYMICGIAGAGIALATTYFISKKIIKNDHRSA